MSLLVIGTVAFDKVETPFGTTDKILGGAGTYISLAASHLTGDIKVVSVVGGDFPPKYLDLFKKHSIDIEGVKIIPEGKTFFWSGKYHENMNNRDTLSTELNVLADFEPVLPPSYKKCKYVMLGNLTPSIQKKVILQMDVRPQLICMDTMNFWMDTTMDDLLDVLKYIDVLTINDEEARQLSGEYSVVLAARKILTMGPRFLIVKKGEHGAMLFHENKIFYAPAVPLAKVVDPTGAGDTFAGGFMGYVAKSGKTDFPTLKKALLYGSALASFTVEKFGTDRLTEITENDINERLRQLSDLVSI